MPSNRYLIVNADDFGRTSGINDGVGQAHLHGIVTSASLMVRWPAAKEAATLARDLPGLSVGLHVDLGEWHYRQGGWHTVYTTADLSEGAVRTEVSTQLERFRHLLGQAPTHIDSHQHVHLQEPVSSVLKELASDLSIPLRESSGVTYRGDFYGGDAQDQSYPAGISAQNLSEILKGLPEGVTEVACHPAVNVDDLDSPYTTARLEEVQVLCDEEIRRLIDELGIRLCNFANFRQKEIGSN